MGLRQGERRNVDVIQLESMALIRFLAQQVDVGVAALEPLDVGGRDFRSSRGLDRERYVRWLFPSRRRSGLRLGCFGRKRFAFAEWRLDDLGLAGELAAELLVVGFGIHHVPGRALHRSWNVISRAIGKEDGNELLADRTGIVQKLTDDPRLPHHAVADTGYFLVRDPAVIGFGTDQQHEIRLLDPLLAPQRPSFRRRVDVLIDLRVDPVHAARLTEFEHTVLVPASSWL